MRAKVVFVVTGYGENVNGGVEQHCKMLAERLVPDYDVEVLSTCVQNYVKGENELPVGDECDLWQNLSVRICIVFMYENLNGFGSSGRYFIN